MLCEDSSNFGLNVCSHCFSTVTKIQKCSRCLTARYCSKGILPMTRLCLTLSCLSRMHGLGLEEWPTSPQASLRIAIRRLHHGHRNSQQDSKTYPPGCSSPNHRRRSKTTLQDVRALQCSQFCCHSRYLWFGHEHKHGEIYHYRLCRQKAKYSRRKVAHRWVSRIAFELTSLNLSTASTCS